SVVSSFDYSNDSIGQRTSRTDYYNGSTVINTFGYNDRRELTNAVMYSNEQSIVYDDIGNRQTSTVGSASSVYTANQLNQYTVINGGMSITPTHDFDGNLTWDGRWHHIWNGENRPIKSVPGIVTNGTCMFEYGYNHHNLRVEKIKKQLSGRDLGYPMNPQADPGSWDAIETRKYVWDGFNIVAEIIIDHVNPATNINYYTWGLDLSGALQGAGGVGGLLSDTKISINSTNIYFAVGDANGNVTEYIDNTGAAKAHYEYSAFGEITVQSNTMTDDFTHRFSTKPFDKKTDLVVYEQRYYKPPFATWLSRDPVEERGGNNLYVIGNNNVINKLDVLGMWSATAYSKGKSRRIYEWESGDTLESLAKDLRLDYGEVSKWMESVGFNKSNNGVPCKVSVPNVIAVFTSKPSWYDTYISIVSHYRRKAESLAANYKYNGYKVIFTKHSTSVASFKSLWKTSGIYGYVYAGHGARPLGLRINSSFNGAIFPSEVSPPYKLAIGRFYACYSDNKGIEEYSSLGAWKDHIAVDSGAEYLGFLGPAFWWSDPNTENIESE
ncbi:MAG: hypothetical protein M0P27_08180, partial [Bacteroidales bacterium]|nr:hypothetical protein [Bacteroidales bacterium]